MRFYHAWHLVFGIVALLTTFAIFALSVNRLVRRKLKLSLVLLGAYVVVHVVLAFQLSLDAAVDDQLISVERLAFVAGVVNLGGVAVLDPLRGGRGSRRYSAVPPGFIVIGGLVLVGGLVFYDKRLTTPAGRAGVI